ncbi:MAG: patatin-like phospholipase family protein [Chloroflexi bacterium]|nr:patatin-like phospholipase family protein [Chloroflexota bacterium]MBP8055373.1 patatin-like phospholipase family protein [Chloroflexota bacterium]
MPGQERKKALVLSGGGGRGAYHVGVLRFLEEHEWVPDIVVGTSIGAVNGAAIASGHNAYSLWALWRRLETKDVQRANLNPLNGNFLLNTSPLRQTLEKEGWVNFSRINSPEAAVHLRVTATEVHSGHLHVFGNSTDLYPSKMRQEPLTLDHIIASCSIPIVYPATELHGNLYWDGATVANTPLGPAIDAGAEEIVVVIMTPFGDEESDGNQHAPKNLLEAASTTLEWALLASFQADMKLFRRVNDLVRLQVENAHLRAQNAVLVSQLRGVGLGSEFVDANGNGIPDILEKEFKQLPDPVIIAPKLPIPVEQIIQYERDKHEQVYRMGYEDARRAWKDAGRFVEGE